MSEYKFYITFGSQYAYEQHPTFAPAHPDGWVTVMAPHEEAAREFAFQRFGTAWSFLYDEGSFDPEYYPRRLLFAFSDHDRYMVGRLAALEQQLEENVPK